MSDAPNLKPLISSQEYDTLESELKAQFLDTFAQYLRSSEREINVYGAPHLGSIELISRNVTRDGLALINSVDPAMRYLLKAWKARNPKRGLHFLRTYLQLIWPNGWIVDQLWQDKNKPYPHGLVARGRDNDSFNEKSHYLTSRIRISIESDKDEHLNISTILPALRSVTPAKFVLDITVLKRFDSSIGLCNGGTFKAVANYSGVMGSFANTASKMCMSNGSGLRSFVSFDCIFKK